MIESIKWLGHGSFLICGEQNIYIDPWRVVKSEYSADIILISHDDFDHCSIADVNKLRHENTVIIGNERVADQIEGTTILRAWQSMSVGRVRITAVPAYSKDGHQHPKERGGLGFVISMNYYDIYYAGDTKLIPEMDHLHPDIAILPIDGRDTLNLAEAVQAVGKLHPRWVLPSNWGTSTDGASSVDAVEFRRLVGDTSEVLLPVVFAGNLE